MMTINQSEVARTVVEIQSHMLKINKYNIFSFIGSGYHGYGEYTQGPYGGKFNKI